MAGNRVVVSTPRWVLITTAVVLTLGVSSLVVVASINHRGSTVSARPTTPPADPEPVATDESAPVAPADSAADPVAAPPVEQPAPAVPAKPAVVCPAGHLSGGVLSATVGPGPISYMPRITVTAGVRNDSNSRVILWRQDTPDVKGYDASGGVAIIELFGDWANTARDAFAIQPGETLTYVTAWDVTQDQLDSVVALYASPDKGSMTAVWPTAEQLAACGSPLPNAGGGVDFPY